MNDLLSFVLDANGGLDRWEKASVLTADVSVGGAFWGRKGWAGLLGSETVTLDTRRERIELTPGQRHSGLERRAAARTGPPMHAVTRRTRRRPPASGCATSRPETPNCTQARRTRQRVTATHERGSS
jgi:hypothetical protein